MKVMVGQYKRWRREGKGKEGKRMGKEGQGRHGVVQDPYAGLRAEK